MPSALLISVRIHDGRYYGVPDWPPSPARLFQALLAGAGLSGPVSTAEKLALEWLERKSGDNPPLIGAPAGWRGQRLMLYMPNNDLDRVGGDPLRMAEVRTARKFFEPYLFDAAVPFFYAWSLDEGEARAAHADTICALAERLYQFGRGIDIAWAWADLLETARLEQLLAQYRGRIYRPSLSGGRNLLDCPHAGSLKSLGVRYDEYAKRFKDGGKGGKKVFIQAPRSSFHRVAYDAPPLRRLYELREPSSAAGFAAWPLTGAAGLVEQMRDGAVARLQRALPTRSDLIARVLIGRRPDGSNDCPASQRVRIVPLPSIGHIHADHAIRRVMVEVPGNCPLDPTDVQWAFSGLELVDLSTGEVRTILTRSADDAFLEHYGAGKNSGSCIWRSVTPLALPQSAFRRRIEPPRMENPKAGPDRTMELTRAAFAVGQALRHAEIDARPDAIRLQREPFAGNGARAEDFASKTRFAKERLWHLEMVFPSLVAGPLVIGDGRFLGLGVMAPLDGEIGIRAFRIIAGLTENPEPSTIARAARRAVMARVRDHWSESMPLSAFFSGHEPNGEPARSSHLAFVFDESARRLLIVAPHVLDHRQATSEEDRHLVVLHKALLDFEQLRAGAAGCLQLRAIAVTSENDSLLAPSRLWESATPYLVTHHAKRIGAEQAVIEDMRIECRRRGLPAPATVQPLELSTIPGLGLAASVRLTFQTAIKGPVLLGRSRYHGGGLFMPATKSHPK